MKRRLIVVAAALGVVGLTGLGACGQGAGTSDTAATDTLTRAQKDSIVAKLPIPGARGVGAAQAARDKANARVLQHDTMRIR